MENNLPPSVIPTTSIPEQIHTKRFPPSGVRGNRIFISLLLVSILLSTVGVFLFVNSKNSVTVKVDTAQVAPTQIVLPSPAVSKNEVEPIQTQRLQQVAPTTTPVLTVRTIQVSGFGYEDTNDDKTYNSTESKLGYMHFIYYDSAAPTLELTNYADVNGNFTISYSVKGKLVIKPSTNLNYSPSTSSQEFSSSASDIKFGFRTIGSVNPGTNNGIIDGFIYHDSNRNLTRDGGENGTRFYKIYLTDANGNLYNTIDGAQATNDDGYFKYTNLPMGTYTFALSNPTGEFDIEKEKTTVTLTGSTPIQSFTVPVYKNY